MRKVGAPESQTPLLAPPKGQDASDDLSYFLAVTRRQIQPAGIASLELNLTAIEIVAAARESARTGRRGGLEAPAARGQNWRQNPGSTPTPRRSCMRNHQPRSFSAGQH